MGRRLGQHFLHDPAILDRIVSALNPEEGDLVLEIGAGKGTLTRRLAPQVRHVTAIEKDRELVAKLSEATGDDELPANVRLFEGDALEIDWIQLMAQSATPGLPSQRSGFKVVGNIPYAITSPLIEKALQIPTASLAVFLIQREVAERLSAEPGGKAYGALTVGVQAVARVERLFSVRAGSFSPPPQVESAVVRLTPLAEPLLAGHERKEFRRFVAAVFGQRRKQLSRALRTVTDKRKEEIGDALHIIGIDASSRPEVLPPPQLLEIFRVLGQG